MKKTNLLNLLFLAVLCLGFTSCSNDDDDEHIKEESIVGTWVFLKEDTKVDFKTNNPEFTQPFTDFFVDETLYPKDELTFREDGTYKLVSTWNSVEIEEGSYTYQNGVVTFFGTEDEDKDGSEDEDKDGSEDENPKYTVKVSGDAITMEKDYVDTYSFGWMIDWVINNNESFKDLDPASIKVEKMVVQMVGSRQ